MSSTVVPDEAFVSLVTNNSYGNGALVLGYSLRRVNTTRKLALLISRGVSDAMREKLSRVWDHIEDVNILDSQDAANLALLTRPELGITFTKIHCWNLTQYRKCVFLDADTLVLKNCDELFERRELSAVPDIGWPDCFNSGVFVFEPSVETYNALIRHAVETGSFDGGDQGLLNSFFSDWRTSDISRLLSFIYNMSSSASYSYAPAFKQFGKDVKIVHFLGPMKPWHYAYNHDTGNVYQPSSCQGNVPHEVLFLQLWWDIYNQSVLHTDSQSPTRDISHGMENLPLDSTCSTNLDDLECISPTRDISHGMENLPLDSTSSTNLDDLECISPTRDISHGIENLPFDSTCSTNLDDLECISGDVNQITEDMLHMHVDEEPSRTAIEDQEQERQHQESWENGRIDYMGRDKFENIEQRMDSFVGDYRDVADVPTLV